jgi:transporter family protein
LPAWLTYSILTLLLWGLWAFLPRLATRTLDPTSTLLFQQMGALIGTLCVLATAGFRFHMEIKGVSWALLTGMLGVFGLLCFLQAVTRYRLSVVVMMTALYPLITVGLSVLVLREKLTALQWLGVALAMTAILLMSTPSES